MSEEVDKKDRLVDSMQYFMNSVKESMESLREVKHSILYNALIICEKKVTETEISDMLPSLFEAYHSVRCAEGSLMKFLKEISKEFTG